MALPLPVWEMFRKLEQDIIARICTRIGAIGKISITDARALRELQDIGYDMVAIQREVASTMNLATRKIYDIFEGAVQMEYNAMRSGFDLSGRAWIPFADNVALQNLVSSITSATAGQINNMSKTMAVVNTVQGNRKIGAIPLAQYYSDAVDYAALCVRTGQTDFYSAMRHIVRDMSDHGLRTVDHERRVDYESGYSRRMDTAVRANITDAQARMSREYAGIIGEQFGSDGMEISYHSGPRPSHAWIGGIQVDMETYFRDVLPLMEEPNCYHRSFPIILGISEPTYTPEELEALYARDAEEHDWNGKKLNAYEAQQQQRRYETAIRRQKDRAMAANALGDAEYAQISRARAKAIMAEYRRFSEAMGIQIKPTRTRVEGYR